MTKKEIKDLAKELIIEMGVNLDEGTLNKLSTKIVARMMKLKAMEDWYEHIYESKEADNQENLELTEEDDAIGEAARLMTLMNMFQDNEEYEKCAIIKRQMNRINKILNKNKGNK